MGRKVHTIGQLLEPGSRYPKLAGTCVNECFIKTQRATITKSHDRSRHRRVREENVPWVEQFKSSEVLRIVNFHEVPQIILLVMNRKNSQRNFSCHSSPALDPKLFWIVVFPLFGGI